MNENVCIYFKIYKLEEQNEDVLARFMENYKYCKWKENRFINTNISHSY